MNLPEHIDYEFLLNLRVLYYQEGDPVAHFLSGYQPGDPLLAAYEGQVKADQLLAMAEDVFIEHNRDDRPTAQICPSMSVGDVVIFQTPDGNIAMSCEAMGFEQVDLPPDEDIERTKSYIQLVKEVEKQTAEDLPLENRADL